MEEEDNNINNKTLREAIMAACGGLGHIFEKPLPDSPTFLQTLSPWNRINPVKTLDHSSFTELFGELHFKDNHESPPPSSFPSPDPVISTDADPPISSLDIPKIIEDGGPKSQYTHGRSDSFSSMSSESLSICTEGLGFESCDEVDDNNNGHKPQKEPGRDNHKHKRSLSKTSIVGEEFPFPPPISCIGRCGKPWVCFKSLRQDGRLILKEIRIPTQEFLHACRENGRLKMQFVHSDDEYLEDEESVDKNNEDSGENHDGDREELYINGQGQGRKGEADEETSNSNLHRM